MQAVAMAAGWRLLCLPQSTAPAHLEQGSLRVCLHQLLQAAPVCPRRVFGDVAAALQVQVVHHLADVVMQHIAVAPDALLEL